jgi:TPR repeat protein
MSEEQGSGGTDDQNASGENQDNKPKDSVSYESHKRLLAEKKKLQAERDEVAKKLADIETEKLQAAGKQDEVIVNLKAEKKRVEDQFLNVIGNFAQKSVESALEAEAAKHGCVDVGLLKKAVDLGEIDVNKEDFSVDSAGLKKAIEAAQAKHPYLFKKAGPQFADGTPAGKKTGEAFSAAKLKNLKGEQLKELLAMKLAK